MNLQALSTTIVETWTGTDLSQVGPVYPFVGTEFILFIVGLVFWLAFHFFQAGIEKREFEADDKAAHDPERLARVFKDEASGH